MICDFYMLNVFEYTVTKGDEGVCRTHKKGREEFVEYGRLVRQHIVYQCDTACLAVSADNAFYGAVSGREERHPIATDEDVRRGFANLPAHPNPIERIARVEYPSDG